MIVTPLNTLSSSQLVEAWGKAQSLRNEVNCENQLSELAKELLRHGLLEKEYAEEWIK
jgi:hypothetical protein